MKPSFRYRLKSEIIGRGFKTVTEFSEASGISLSKISRIIRGWEIPSADTQNRLASALGIDAQDLVNLL